MKSVTDWNAWVPWADLVVFDSPRMSYGGTQPDYEGGVWAQETRRKGKPTIGGSKAADDLEHDRLYGQKVWEQELGLKGQPMFEFKGPRAFDAARKHIEVNPGPYALKHNADVSKALATVQWTAESTLDFIDWLEDIWPQASHGEQPDFVLQPAVKGIEISTTALWDGRRWRGTFILQEYKRLMDGDFGPMTGAMGEMAHEQRGAPLFRRGLEKLAPWLERHEFRGCIDLSFIATQDGITPLEWTPRFGYGSVYSILAMTDTAVSDWLWSLATGEGAIRTKGGWSGYVSVCSGTYPQSGRNGNRDIRILGDWHNDSVWPSCVRLDDTGHLSIAGDAAHLLYCSGWGRDPPAAREDMWRTFEQIQVLPYATVRDDVGRRIVSDWQRLKEWGWVN